LQQAIRLLQLNRIELRGYVQELVDANPLLDQEEVSSDSDNRKNDSPGTEMAESRNAGSDQEFSTGDYETEQWQAEPDQWTDNAGWSGEFSERQIADDTATSLHEHLLAQIRLAHFSKLDAVIATAIVYALDDDGFLAGDIVDIRESLLPEVVVEDDEITAVLHRVQRLEPVGVASRNPGECIWIQLRAQPTGTEGVDLALRLVRDHLHLVAANDYKQMLHKTGATSEDLKVALELIRGLEPRPGARYDNRHDEYLVPDVYVRLDGEEWVTTLSPESNPSLRLNKYYIDLLRKSGGKDAEYLQSRLQEARWLLSSLAIDIERCCRPGWCA
jgi:RNA polymerase sigma-54 factor